MKPDHTHKQLTAWCREWQRTLRLQDWRVRVRYAKDETELRDSAGNCAYNIDLKSAVIRVNPFRSKSPNDAWCCDEVVLIHELLHLPLSYLWEWKDNTPAHQLAEQFIENTAWALYRTKHGKKAKDDFVDSP